MTCVVPMIRLNINLSLRKEDQSTPGVAYSHRDIPNRAGRVGKYAWSRKYSAGFLCMILPGGYWDKRDVTPRFCVDYRELSARMKGDPWPITKIQEIFDGLEGGKVFTTLDLFSGY